MTDAKRQTFVHCYDITDRLTGIDAPGTTNDVTLGYDTCTNDTWGQIVAHQGVGYGYDASARVRSVTYPSGNVAT